MKCALQEHAFADVFQPQPLVVLADMNGDGLADLVAVGQKKITYWPSDGRGNWTTCRGDKCPVSAPGYRTPGAEMVAPDLGPDANHHRVHLADVNGDGFSDLIQVTDAGLHIFLNQDGGNSGTRSRSAPASSHPTSGTPTR
jgi:FG-GAP-like repeat